MEERYLKKENEVVKEGYKYFDWENGWKETPDMVKKCYSFSHIKFDISRNPRGSDNLRGCDSCKWYSKYDCSD